MMVMQGTKHLAELTVDLFNRASDDAELSERMSFANTTVHLHFTDPAGNASCTVWLDRLPIGAEMGAVGQAEIELFAPTQIWMDLYQRKRQLPIEIVRGEVTYTGPVRKFLRVVPLLSSFDFEGFKASPPYPGGTITSSAG